jgi:hypothetical protein
MNEFQGCPGSRTMDLRSKDDQEPKDDREEEHQAPRRPISACRPDDQVERRNRDEKTDSGLDHRRNRQDEPRELKIDEQCAVLDD